MVDFVLTPGIYTMQVAASDRPETMVLIVSLHHSILGEPAKE
ncbi:hypothetical protein [Aestuariivirga sp.]